MPAVNPRIAVYLPKHVAATVRRCAAIRGVSRSALIAEILIEAQPTLERVANLLEMAARTDRTALKEWAATLAAAQGEIEADATAVLAKANAAFDAAPAAPLGGRRRRPRRTPGQ
jgi:uncharacterized protein (DUF2252 family)